MTPDWNRAACLGHDGDLWFPDGYDREAKARNQAAAIAICRDCPIVEGCLEAALDHEGAMAGANRAGVFGGLTPHQRHRLSRQRAMGRRVAA